MHTLDFFYIHGEEHDFKGNRNNILDRERLCQSSHGAKWFYGLSWDVSINFEIMRRYHGDYDRKMASIRTAPIFIYRNRIALIKISPLDWVI